MRFLETEDASELRIKESETTGRIKELNPVFASKDPVAGL